MSPPTTSPFEAALRVAFVSTQYPPAVGGGIGRFTADLARGFAAAGHEVHVFSAQGPTSTLTFEDGVWVHRFPEVAFIPDDLAGEAALLDLSRIGAVYRELSHAHGHRPFDVVSSPVWLAEGLLVAMDPRFVSILSLHTTTRTLAGLERYWRGTPRRVPLAVLERLAVGAHRWTHASSRAVIAKVTEEYGAPRGPFVVGHGVADHAARVGRRRPADAPVRVLVVGRLEARKGGDILLDVMAAVLPRFATAEFVLVGEPVAMDEFDGRALPEAARARFAAEPALLSRVHFAGVVTDEALYQHYADADIFLFVSRSESFGLPVIEAMSFGLPVVASRTGAVADVVIHGEHGLLAEVGDRTALVEALGALIEDRPRRRRLGAAARERYLTSGSLAGSVVRTLEAYRSVVEQAGRAAPEASGGLAERFAEVVAAVTACPGPAALRVARRLIGDAFRHDGYAQAIRAIWPLDDRAFVARLYERHVRRRLRSGAAAVARVARELRRPRQGTRRQALGDLATRARTAAWPARSPRRRRTAIVWLTHFADAEALASLDRLASQAAAFGPVICAYHAADRAGPGIPDALRRVSPARRVHLADRDLAAALPCRFGDMADRGASLNDTLDLLHLACVDRLPDFDDWWFVEYDTDFSADWRDFFSRFDDCEADLLGTTIYPRTLDPGWFFWPRFEAPASVPPALHTRGFFPVVRLSRRFAETYRAEVGQGWHGHFEALYPSVALARGLRVEDIGGAGPFVPEPRRGLLYWNTYQDAGLSPGTFRFAPAVSAHYFAPGNADFAEPGRLWHPIKTRGYRRLMRARRRERPDRWPPS